MLNSSLLLRLANAQKDGLDLTDEKDYKVFVLAISRRAEKEGFKAGLKASSDYLLSTSDDYKQIADRLEKSGDLTRPSLIGRDTLRAEHKSSKEKAQLLQGQANLILCIKR
jgi:hypothetical protein